MLAQYHPRLVHWISSRIPLTFMVLGICLVMLYLLWNICQVMWGLILQWLMEAIEQARSTAIVAHR